MKEDKKIRNIAFLIGLCCILLAFVISFCKQKERTETKKEQTEEEKDNTKISKKTLQDLINDAEKRMSDNDVQPIKKITYDPFYYKKVYLDNKKEFVESILSEKDKRKYFSDNVLILQIHYKDGPEIDYMIYVREDEKWKFLQRYK